MTEEFVLERFFRNCAKTITVAVHELTEKKDDVRRMSVAFDVNIYVQKHTHARAHARTHAHTHKHMHTYSKTLIKNAK